ncbi:MAG: APC family permease [Steroidobacteraceae bacterium]
MAAERGSLQDQVGLIGVITMGVGAALGSSVFAVLGPATKVGGSGILLTIGLAALPMVFFAVVYAFLASISPRTGASFEWPRQFINPFVGFMVSWLRILGQVGLIVTFATVLVNYVHMVVSLPGRLTEFVLFCAVMLLNIRGIVAAIGAQTVVLCLFLLVLAIFVVTGVPYVALGRITPVMPHGLWPVLFAVPLMVTLFTGIESATEIGEEVKNAKRNIPLGIGIGMGVITVVYFAVSFVALGLVGPGPLGASDAPLVTAGRQSLGSFATLLIVTGAVLALLKSLNASYILFARSLFAMGRAGYLSRRLGQIHQPRSVPRAALVVAFAGCCLGLFMPQGMIFLFVASSIPLVVKYMSICVCGIRVLRQAGPGEVKVTRLRGLTIRACAWLGVGAALGILGLAIRDEWRASAIIAGWTVCGLIYWKVAGFRNDDPVRSDEPGRAYS